MTGQLGKRPIYLRKESIN